MDSLKVNDKIAWDNQATHDEILKYGKMIKEFKAE